MENLSTFQRISLTINSRPRIQTWGYGVLAFLVPTLVAMHKLGFKVGTLSDPLFFYGDEFFGANYIFTFMHSFSLVNHTFGFPKGQDFSYAFVSSDMLPHLFSAFIGLFKNSPYFGMNVYLLITFGLVGVGFFVGAKILGAGNLSAFLFSLVVSLLPQHLSNPTQALTIISYFFIPVLVATFVLKISYRKSRIDYLTLPRQNVAWIILCVISGALYSYYTLGTILIIGTLAILVSLFDGTLDSIKAVLSGLGFNLLGFLIVSIPSLLNLGRTVGGINYYRERNWQAAYVNSGSLIQSLSPHSGTVSYRLLSIIHKNWIFSFDQLNTQINGIGVFQEGWVASISLTLIVLYFALLVYRGKMSRVTLGSDKKSRSTLSPSKRDFASIFPLLGILALIALLWMWAGGLGTFFAMFINETLRGYARFSVFAVTALALACAVGVTELRSSPNNKFNVLKFLVVICTLILVLDGFTINVTRQSAATREDVVAIDKMLTLFPKNCAVLQFPVVHFPYENPGWPSYALMAPGLAGNRPDLRWSAGMVGGSPDWAFMQKYRTFQDKPNASLFKVAKRDGFCAVLVDSQVWKTFYDFQPFPSFPRVPSVPLSEFQKILGTGVKISTPVDTYFLYRL